MSEKWFSPFSENNVKEVNLTDDNCLVVTPESGMTLEAVAMYDGFIIYKPKGDPQSAASGDLELVFYPDTWSSKLKKSFDGSKWTELPPGRVVYKNIPSYIVRQGICDLIFNCYQTNRNHTVLSYIPEPSDPNASVTTDTLRSILDSVSNCAVNDADREKRMKEEIDCVVDIFIKKIHEKALDGISVFAGDVLFSKPDDADNLTLEIRNLYGEALNPYYYIKKSDVNENQLYEAIFQNAKITDKARKKVDDTPLEIKIPRNGGIEYTMLNASGNNSTFKDSGYYKSRLIWEYTFDNAINAYKAQAAVRPGANATVSDITVSRAAVKTTIENIWDDLYEYINKYSEIFEVPAEVAMAIIYVEAAKDANKKVINHSMRIEETWEPEQDYPKFYADLMDYIKSNANSSFSMDTVVKYWTLAGGYINTEEGFLKPPKIKEIKTPPIAELPMPYNEGEKLSAENKINITWKQLLEMASVCPQLLQGIQITVPALGKSDGKYHYDLIKESPLLGEKAAELYFNKAGGIKLADGKEIPSVKNAVAITPPSPLNMNAAITELSNDAAASDKRITWQQLIEIFRIFKSNGINVPLIKYKLQPLAKDPAKKVTGQDIAKDEIVRNKLGLDEANSQLLLDRYQKLWTKSLIYSLTLGPSGNVPGIKAAGTNDYLTMEEVRKLSKLFPDYISIGIQQSLVETAACLIIPYIKNHYDTDFFTNNVTSVQNMRNPSAAKDAIIDWLWDYSWDSYEIQVILLIAYIKRNNVFFWQGAEADNKNYRVGERMTSFDFPRVAAAYNSGVVRIHRDDNKNPNVEHESDWGCYYACNYLTGVNTEGMFALNEALKLLSQQTDASKKAAVRLAPVLEADTGMGKY